MLAQHDPGEQHAERWHQEVIGARGRGATHLDQVKPKAKGQDRSAQSEERKGSHEMHVRRDVPDIVERESEWEQHYTCGEILHAIADPEAAFPTA